jgi:hypothetical protein
MDIKISSLVAAMVNKAGQNIILTISLLYYRATTGKLLLLPSVHGFRFCLMDIKISCLVAAMVNMDKIVAICPWIPFLLDGYQNK